MGKGYMLLAAAIFFGNRIHVYAESLLRIYEMDAGSGVYCGHGRKFLYFF